MHLSSRAWASSEGRGTVGKREEGTVVKKEGSVAEKQEAATMSFAKAGIKRFNEKVGPADCGGACGGCGCEFIGCGYGGECVGCSCGCL